jgi:cysteine desulfuration protein SufE
MTGAIDAELQDLADEFDLVGAPADPERYGYLMELGRRLAPLADAERREANKVRGCASQVWLVTEPQPEGVLIFRGDSDSDIVRGLIAVLIRLYSGRPAGDILAFDVKGAFDRLGFSGAISAQRSNGFFSMVERVRRDAAALAGA